MSLLVETFYLFFEGIMLFQVLYFGMIYILSGRKDVLYYSLLNLVSAVYFFLNAPDTFLRINETIVFNSVYYTYVNYALILLMGLMYLFFLKEIFSDLIPGNTVLRRIYRLTICLLPVLYLTFSLFEYKGWNTNLIFYLGYLVNGPFCICILLKNRRPKGYHFFIVLGMLVIFISVTMTLWLTVRYNAGREDLILDHYPLLPIKTGMLIDVVLFQLALTQRWQNQENQLAIQRLKADIEIENVKKRINTELHDDIGSILSGITMYSRLAFEKGKESSIADLLMVIQKASDETLNRLKDIVWINNPGTGTCSDMIERLKNYTVMMSRSQDIKVEMNYSPDMPQVKLPEEIVYQFYLIGKEAVNNTVKYSEATTIKISFLIQNDKVIFEVEDNGSGFDAETVKKGNGLDNIATRASSIGAEHLIESKIGMGTRISLSFNLP